MPAITQQVDARVRFTVAADPLLGYPAFSDGLYYDVLPSQSQVTADETARYQAWVTATFVSPPPAPPAPTDAQLLVTATDLGTQSTQVVATMGTVADQLNAIAAVVLQAIQWLETLHLSQAQVQQVATFLQNQIINMSKLLSTTQQKTVLNNIIAALQAAVPA